MSWQELLDTLRIKYQHKASYDFMLSVFHSLEMTAVEDCAAFSSKLEQKLSFVQAMCPDKLNDTQYWQILRERFFHGIPANNRANIRTEYSKGTEYYPLLQAARMIESELKADPHYKTSTDKPDSKSDMKGKAKDAAGILQVDGDIQNLEKAWSQTANEMKAMQTTLQDIKTCIGNPHQNRAPQPTFSTIEDRNSNTQANNNTQSRGRGFYRGREGRGRGRGYDNYQDRPPICWWCKGNVSQEEPQHRMQGELVEGTQYQFRNCYHHF